MTKFLFLITAVLLASCMGGLGNQEDGAEHDEPSADTTADDTAVVPDVTDGTGDVTDTPVDVPDIPVEPVECTDSAQCSDGDACNGDEICDPVMHVCTPGTPPPDGTTCGPGGVCCGGLCVGCCFDRDCDDANACTQDRCEGGACTSTSLPDGAPCGGGICCGAECRAGGNCCSDADCTAECRGTARPCEEFDDSTCDSQLGCTSSGTGSCGGAMNCGDLTTEADCMACTDAGCVWFYFMCMGGSTILCGNISSQTTCTTCDCTWTSACSGTHAPCPFYADWESCNGQYDCYWSTCSAFSCT